MTTRKRFLLLMLPIVVISVAIAAARAPLTAAQLLRLIGAKTPDAVVAAEISERGIREAIDLALIEQARKTGAGPLTLRVLDKTRPRSALRISGARGTAVTMNGNLVGKIGENGLLVLGDLWPGQYEIGGELLEHSPDKQRVVVRPAASADVILRMTSIYGFITVTTKPEAAKLSLEGEPSSVAPMLNERVRIGRYLLRVEAPYHKPHSETIEVGAEQSIDRSITLTVDEQQLDSLLARMQQNYSAKRFQDVVTDASSYLKVAAESDAAGRAIALTQLASASIHTRDYQTAAVAGVQGLSLGGSLAIPVKYNSARSTRTADAASGSLYMADGVVNITKSTVRFDATYGYGDESFVVTPDKILEADVDFGSRRIHLKVAKMNKQGNKEESRHYYLYSAGAKAVGGGQGSVGAQLDCNACDNSMSLLQELLISIRR